MNRGSSPLTRVFTARERPVALGRLVLWTALAFFNTPLASAQSGRFLEISGELSPVTNGTLDTTWRAARAAGGVQEEGRFGWTLSGERHQRREAVDWAYQAGGFRRAGDWTLSGSLGFGINPTFLYRHSFEGELARRAIGGLVVHGGYRHLVSPEATVHVVLPAMSWYFRRGELQARGY